MAKRSRMTILKRQRELKKAEKAARKRMKRQGHTPDAPLEPMPTVSFADLLAGGSSDDDEGQDSGEKS